MKTALLIIDMQKGLFTLSNPIYKAGQVKKNINSLIEQAKEADVSIIFIQHCGGKEHPLEESTEGYQFLENLNIDSKNIVLEKKHPDAFHSTALHSILNELGVKNLVIAGLQTEYCVDSTCRRAYSLDYQVTLVGDAHSTCDGEVLKAEQIISHHNEVLGALFATVTLTKDIKYRTP